MTAPSPGTVLDGKYLVEEVLGLGGMGVVVAARHLHLEQRVALKFLLPEAVRHPEVVARFAREAKAAARIKGEHVVRVHDVGTFGDGAPFMVMELLEGEDLAKRLTSGPLPVEEAVRWILEACEALAEAHAAGVVHRDLKPQNLFLAKQPGRRRTIVKVLDFGISKLADSSAASLTNTSSMMGTPYYMSPEQLIAPKTVEARADQWALGIILYELLAGRPPFVGETVPEILAQILKNQPTPLSSYRPDVPAGLEAVIARCMRSEAKDRFSSVAELALELAPFASPEDRASVEVTARVLGFDPVGVASTTPARMSPARPPTPAHALTPGGTLPVTPMTTPSAVRPAIVPPAAVHPSTMQGVASTPEGVPKRGSLGAILAIGALLLVGGGGAVYFLTRGPRTATADTSAPSATATAATTSASGAPASAATLALPPLSATEPVVPPAETTAKAHTAATRVSPSSVPSTLAAPSASAHAIASAVAPATSGSTKPASTNPLQMGIK